MESTGQNESQPVKRPRFWVGPFVAGCCFALGYGITHRVVTLQSNAETPTPESFEPALFPGESMEALRGRNGGDSDSFQVDLKAVEARLEAEREKDPDAEELAEQAQQAEQELQATGVAPAPPAEPDWTEPTLPAFEPEPAPVAPQDPPAPPVQPAVVTEPLPPPEPAIEEPVLLAPPPPLPVAPAEPLPAQP